MSKEDDAIKFMKKLINVISNMSETLQALEERMNLSNRQMAQLTKQVGIIASKLNKLDLEVEEEFMKIGNEHSQIQANADFQNKINKMEKELSNIPEEFLDDELQKLLKEEKESEQKKREKA